MRPFIVCTRCEQQRRHKARGLCGHCYGQLRYLDQLDQYPLVRDSSMYVDDVAVERAADWLVHYYKTTTARERAARTGLESRPRLSRGERIAVLRAIRDRVPTYVAVRALGISGNRTRLYLEEAAA